MKDMIEDTYRELLNTFQNDENLQKIIHYFEKKPILDIFTNALLVKYNKPKQKKKPFKSLHKAAHYPLISQHLLPNQEISDLQESINWIKKEYQIKDSPIADFESLITREFKLTDEEHKKYFSYNLSYNLMALIYSTPFTDLPAYDEIKTFYYYLIMYINLELSYNKFIVLDRFEPFLAKLDVQLKMIKSLSILDAENYNELIRKLNRWFTRKALYESIKELEKISGGSK